MKKILINTFLILSLSLSIDLYSQEQEQIISINDVYGDQKTLEEWNNPGKYSPVNMFDDDSTTCFAEGNRDQRTAIFIDLKFDIECDEVQILSGLSKDKNTFLSNNRPKEIVLWLSPDRESYNAKNCIEKEFILEDKIIYQKMILGKSCKFGFFIIQVLDVYPGTKYNDTCITELKFFNKDKEIPIKDVEKLKKDYVKWVGERLMNIFKGGNYRVYSSGELAKARINKEGILSYYDYAIGKIPPLPTRVFVNNSKLYMTLNGKTGIVDYTLFQDGTLKVLVDAIGDYKYRDVPVFEPILEKKK
jgi:hypothetical protein